MKKTATSTDDSGTVQVRRISWQVLWLLRPDLRPKPANDNTADQPEAGQQRAA